MRVVICDDDKSYIDCIYPIIQSTMDEKGISAQIDTFTDSAELFNSGNYYDLAFLDVEMKLNSGIETARELKAVNKNIIVFFITSYDKYLDEAMDINAFRFIKKTD